MKNYSREVFSDRFGCFVDMFDAPEVAFYCDKCGIVDYDETHWKDGKHICDADW